MNFHKIKDLEYKQQIYLLFHYLPFSPSRNKERKYLQICLTRVCPEVKQSLLTVLHKMFLVKNRPFRKIFLLKTNHLQNFSCLKQTCDKPFCAKFNHLHSEQTVQIIEPALLSFQKPSSLIRVLIIVGRKEWQQVVRVSVVSWDFGFFHNILTLKFLTSISVFFQFFQEFLPPLNFPFHIEIASLSDCFPEKIVFQKKISKIATVTRVMATVSCCYILALVLTCFLLKKGRATFFDPKQLLRVSCIWWCYFSKYY